MHLGEAWSSDPINSDNQSSCGGYSFLRQERNKIKTLKERVNRRKSRGFKPVNMLIERFRDEDVFQRLTFLADFQQTVALIFFKLMMLFCHPVIRIRVIEADFFRKYQHATWQERTVNFFY